jgi:hypothetical protein
MIMGYHLLGFFFAVLLFQDGALCVHQFVDDPDIKPGLPGTKIEGGKYPWYDVAIEIEFWGKDETMADKAKRPGVDAHRKPIEDALQSAIKKSTPLSNKKSREKMSSMNVKSGHFSKDINAAWNLEVENPGENSNQCELASPTSLSEEEAVFAMSVYNNMADKFTPSLDKQLQTRGAATHVHVNAKCLLKDDARRLVGLLLIWELFHSAIVKDMKCERLCMDQYAKSIQEESPQFLVFLQSAWNAKKVISEKELVSAFKHFATTLSKPTKADRKLCDDPDMVDHTGLRNFAINVCHLLDVDCCRNCNKNKTPKFGAVEFRVFKGALGPELQYQVALAERLVQATCKKTLEELNTFMIQATKLPRKDADALFKFLEIDTAELASAFENAGPASDDEADEILKREDDE